MCGLTMRRLGADAVFMDTRETLVVAPTSDGTAVDIDYEASNRRLDAWSRRTGTHQVSTRPELSLLLLAPRLLEEHCLFQAWPQHSLLAARLEVEALLVTDTSC